MQWVVFLLTALFASAVAAELGPKRRPIADRLKRTLPAAGRAADSEPRATRPSAFLHALVRRPARRRDGEPTSASRLLVRAGVDMTPAELVLLSAVLGGAAGCAGWLLSGVVAGVLLAAAGTISPRLYLAWRFDQRLREFRNQLPSALDMLSNCLRSGYSLLQSIDFVSAELPAPISEELDRVKREVRVDIPLEQALLSMLDRVPSADLDLVVTAILIHKDVGGNLTEIFDRITATIRDRVRLQGEIRTLTAQGRVSGIIIGGLPLALAVLLWLIDRAYMAPLVQTPIGRGLIVMGLGMQLVGALVIRRMIRLEV